MSEKLPIDVTNFTQEIRFAVVMYGGSSLSIYMYGIAQELLRLVRATAPGTSQDKKNEVYNQTVSGSERIYRELGKRLVRGQPAKVGDLKAGDEIRTRFVIDVLSGTSAGGINSVFLAKALANDLKLSPLRDLWVDTADFAKLMNDSQGIAERHQRQQAPKSLVNSPLMFSLLLKALQRMDPQKPAADRDPETWESPYVDQLDLFTTFTDIQGKTISLKLADAVALERQHLHNFHFTYSTDRAGVERTNDFLGSYNPFLAFAARASSAHQAAFEPMTLEDIKKEGCNPGDRKWRKFYEEYLQPESFGSGKSPDDLAGEFQTRPLADGGTLDNSPFTFAIDQLRLHHARLPVDRKLIYVEPDPGHPEKNPDSNHKPDAIKNAVMALSTIPSYQFIRDDIRRVLERNLLVARVARVLNGVEKDYDRIDIKPVSGDEFRKCDLKFMTHQMGTAWGGYHQLRVMQTTDDLTLIVASAAGFKEESIEFAAIRYLVREWRHQSYVPHFSDPRPADQKSENEFLYEFDLERQIRRLKFVIGKAADMSCFDGDLEEIAKIAKTGDEWSRKKNERSDNEDARDALSAAITRLSDVLTKFYVQQQRLVASVDSTTHPHPLAAALGMLKTSLSDTWDLLLTQSPEVAANTAEIFVRNHKEEFDSLTSAVREAFAVIAEASKEIKGDAENDGILKVTEAPTTANLVKKTLRYYYDRFDQYDMVSYPILYSTGVGDELDEIEIFRISPEDVKLPIGDSSKLAGLSLGHFGALVDRKYRLNDILWGRLDCAERLITLLLRSAPPDAGTAAQLEELRLRMIREAQEEIVCEEIEGFPLELQRKLGFARDVDAPAPTVPPPTAAQEIATAKLSPEVRGYLSSLFHGENPLDRFTKNYRMLHEPDVRGLVSLAGRASRVLGKMLDDIGEQYQINKIPQVAWLTRLLRVVWGFAEISLPNSFANIIAHHALRLLYVFEAVLIIGGLLFSNSSVEHFGLIILGITLAVNAGMLVIKDAIQEQSFWTRFLKLVAVGASIVVVLTIGLVIGAIWIDPLWALLDYIHQHVHLTGISNP